LFAATSALRFDTVLTPLLTELTGAAAVTSRLAAAAATANVLAGADAWLPSRRPAGALGRYVHALSVDAGPQDVALAISANRSVSGLLTVDIAAADLDDDERDEALEEFSASVLPAWVEGPTRLREQLLSALGELDPELPYVLIGAWEEVDVWRLARRMLSLRKYRSFAAFFKQASTHRPTRSRRCKVT
jgi:hypothetical protein